MKLRKIWLIALAAVMVFALAACGAPKDTTAPADTSAPADTAAPADTTAPADTAAPAESGGESIKGATVAFIVPADDALGINDKGWIQKTWEGVSEYCNSNGKTCTWYRPTDNSTQGYQNAIATAINSGTEVIVTLGFQPVEALAVAQYDYPDTYFISVEGNGVESDINTNHFAIFHQVDEAGFLAGMAAVKGGFTNIGVLNGLDIPPMNIWVWGYLQGANYAAGKLGLEGITMTHTYANTSSASAEVQTMAASWYADGMDLIMPMLAGGNNSLFAAADAAQKPCFGADVDQGVESDMVLTSPIKKLDITVSAALASVYDGTFPGGTYKWYTAEDGAVGLATDHWRVPNYTVEEYEQDLQNFIDDVDGVRTGLITQDQCPSIDELWAAMPEHYIEFVNIK